MRGKPQPKTIDDLEPHPRNPRRMKDGAAKGLRRSLERYGDLSRITFNVRTGRLVGGHQRLRELRELGGVYRDRAIWVGDQDYPVRLVDWTEPFEREAMVAANNEAIQGEWFGLDDILREIRAGMDLEEFTDLRFDALAESLHLDFAMPDPGMPDLPTDDDKNFWQMTFVLSTPQKETVMAALANAETQGGSEDPSNQNKNGNLLAFICANFS